MNGNRRYPSFSRGAYGHAPDVDSGLVIGVGKPACAATSALAGGEPTADCGGGATAGGAPVAAETAGDEATDTGGGVLVADETTDVGGGDVVADETTDVGGGVVADGVVAGAAAAADGGLDTGPTFSGAFAGGLPFFGAELGG